MRFSQVVRSEPCRLLQSRDVVGGDVRDHAGAVIGGTVPRSTGRLGSAHCVLSPDLAPLSSSCGSPTVSMAHIPGARAPTLVALRMPIASGVPHHRKVHPHPLASSHWRHWAPLVADTCGNWRNWCQTLAENAQNALSLNGLWAISNARSLPKATTRGRLRSCFPRRVLRTFVWTISGARFRRVEGGGTDENVRRPY
jgi:hypothetical protein